MLIQEIQPVLHAALGELISFWEDADAFEMDLSPLTYSNLLRHLSIRVGVHLQKYGAFGPCLLSYLLILAW